MNFLGRSFRSGEGRPDDVFTGLRSQVLGPEPDDLQAGTDDSGPIYGVLMETGAQGGSATLVCLEDGTVSLYTTTGGGVIGAGAHESVRQACLELLAWSNRYAGELMGACAPAQEFPLPGPGAVFFYLLTTSGVHLARCKEARLAAREDPFSNLFSACHVVLAEARGATQRQESSE